MKRKAGSPPPSSPHWTVCCHHYSLCPDATTGSMEGTCAGIWYSSPKKAEGVQYSQVFQTSQTRLQCFSRCFLSQNPDAIDCNRWHRLQKTLTESINVMGEMKYFDLCNFVHYGSRRGVGGEGVSTIMSCLCWRGNKVLSWASRFEVQRVELFQGERKFPLIGGKARSKYHAGMVVSDIHCCESIDWGHLEDWKKSTREQN